MYFVHTTLKRLLTDERFVFVTLLLVALTGLSTVVAAPALLEGATRKQCATHDWPAEQHRAHVEFCVAQGYPTFPN